MENTKKKSMVRRLYDAGFNEDKSWNAWFFDNVYRDEDAMLLAPGGNPVSCLLLHRYDFTYPGGIVPMGYISGATTLASSRSRGYMGELMRMSLAEANARGDVFVSLIPAERRLYNYYDRFGFATVVYTDIQRYTSAHNFTITEGYRYIEPEYKAFSELERTRVASVLHSEADFRAILDDLGHDRGAVSFVVNPDGDAAAMAFAVPGRIENHVREIIYNDEAAADMVLGDIMSRLGNGLPLEVWCAPTGSTDSLRTRGMMRIVNVEVALGRIAEAFSGIDQVIRVRDSYIPDNNGVFILHGGRLNRVDSTMRRLTLDVDIAVLTKILFSAPRVGEIFGLPTARAMLPLMLD